MLSIKIAKGSENENNNINHAIPMPNPSLILGGSIPS
jgi:hypothetical protein